MGDAPDRHRLAAILAADVVEYTRLIEKDTDGVVAAWMEIRAGVIDPSVERNHGRIVKLTGDGFLAEFSSVRDAVTCAISMQTALLDHPLHFRMGVSLGDVLDDGQDIHGEGVNIAARLEALAAPGGICVSGAVFEAIRNRVDAEFVDEGEHLVKHVSAPVRIWSFGPGRPSHDSFRATKGRVARGDSPTPVILIGPFGTVGSSEQARDIADEFQEELVLAITRRAGVRVARRQDDETSAAFLLQGKCRVRNDQCRISVSMLVVNSQEVVFSQRFEGDLSNSDQFLESAAFRLSAMLRSRIMARMGVDVQDSPNETLDVQGLLSKAAFLLLRYDPRSTVVARRTLERAVTIAPDNPMALSMLARALSHMVPFGIDDPDEIDGQRALDLADRAISLDASVDFLFHTRSWVRLWLMRDHEGAMTDARGALRVNPSYHKGRQDIAVAQIFSQSPREGADLLEAALDELPAEPVAPLFFTLAGLGRLMHGDQGSAVTLAKEGFERQATMPLQRLVYAATLIHSDDSSLHQKARRVLQQISQGTMDARFLPFSDPADAAWLQKILTQASNQPR